MMQPVDPPHPLKTKNSKQAIWVVQYCQKSTDLRRQILMMKTN